MDPNWQEIQEGWVFLDGRKISTVIFLKKGGGGVIFMYTSVREHVYTCVYSF